LTGGVAHATTFIVNSPLDVPDPGKVTLRDAVTSAEAMGNSGSEVRFSSTITGSTITLTAPLPAITQPTLIEAGGFNDITVSGGGLFRVFNVDGTTNPGEDVTIGGMTISGGHVSGGGPGTYGAAILSKNADLSVEFAVIDDNHAVGSNDSGGGIASTGGGSLSITNSTITGNTAGAHGGGVDTESYSGVTSAISSSTISGNSSGDKGAGAYLDLASEATVENSTIAGNDAGVAGGGIYTYGAQSGDPGVTVTGSTIAGNMAPRGGGIASAGDPLDLDFVQQPTLHDTIVGDNTGATGPDVSAGGGTVNTAFSLVESRDPATIIADTSPNSTIFGEDPQLGALADNGGDGETETMLPANTSPAIDRGKAFGLTTDQRDLTRPIDIPSIDNSTGPGADAADIGAVEVQSVPSGGGSGPTTTPPATPPATTTKKKKCKKAKQRVASSAKKCKKRKKH
jgi:hypothetical protein